MMCSYATRSIKPVVLIDKALGIKRTKETIIKKLSNTELSVTIIHCSQ